jgi:SAM-dependent methyltransferase
LEEPAHRPAAAAEDSRREASVETSAYASEPSGLRRVRPWHPLAYIIWLLPRRLRRLSGELNVGVDGRVLDYGCADKPYRSFFADGVDYVGADLPGNPHADVIINPDGGVGVPDKSFDAVMSTQVLEHVGDPAAYLAECLRVLRPGGLMLLSTHGMMVYHPDPVDLWRWTEAGLRTAVERAGFDVIHTEGVMGLAAVGLQFLQDATIWRLPPVLRPALALCFQPLVGLADRLDSDAARRNNALVFALVAERPRDAVQ